MTVIKRDAFIDGEKGELIKQFSAEVKALDDDSRTAQFIITTAEKDRDGDTINPAGWDLENYKKNPVVLWAHDQRSPPVAKATSIKMVDVHHTPSGNGGRLESMAEFADEETYKFADTVYRLVKGKFLNAVSVGFSPSEWKFREGEDRGIDFLKQELLEYSVVPVPANAGALVRAKEMGIALDPMYQWAEDILDHSDDMVVVRMSGVEREVLEQARKIADPKQRMSVLAKGLNSQPAEEKVDELLNKFAQSIENATKRIESAATEFEEIHGEEKESSSCSCGKCKGNEEEDKGAETDEIDYHELVTDAIKALAARKAVNEGEVK